jgi:hypothetical protein
MYLLLVPKMHLSTSWPVEPVKPVGAGSKMKMADLKIANRAQRANGHNLLERVRIEQLLAQKPVIFDHRLSIGGHQPIGKRFGKIIFDVRMLLRINRNDTIGIRKGRIPLA